MRTELLKEQYKQKDQETVLGGLTTSLSMQPPIADCTVILM